jgi:hypothetical protein
MVRGHAHAARRAPICDDWTWQRCGRYEYRKILMHSTNLDHLARPGAYSIAANKYH